MMLGVLRMVSSKIARTIGHARGARQAAACRSGSSNFSASSPSLGPCRDRLLWLLVELVRQVAGRRRGCDRRGAGGGRPAVEDAIGGGRADAARRNRSAKRLIFCS